MFNTTKIYNNKQWNVKNLLLDKKNIPKFDKSVRAVQYFNSG